MNDIAQKMRESVEAEMSDEPLQNATEEADEEVLQNATQESTVEAEPTEIELLAMDSGWSPEKTDKDGVSLTAEEYMARKPLFNKIRNQGKELEDIKRMVKELKSDNLKIAEAGIKEKENLLKQLEEAKEDALTNLEVDDVRKLDKQINSVREEIAEVPRETEVAIAEEEPYFEAFAKENEWARDDNHPLTMAAEGIARRYGSMHKNEKLDYEDLYRHVHEQIRKDFPEKFQEKREPPKNKVAATKNRATTNYSSKKGMTLNDVPDEDTRRVIQTMAQSTGKTVEEYLKNYTPDDFK